MCEILHRGENTVANNYPAYFGAGTKLTVLGKYFQIFIFNVA